MLASPYRALAPASTNIPSTPTSAAAQRSKTARDDMEMDSDTSSSAMSPRDQRSCFCGNVIRDGDGIYCSASCARSDAFSTLCSSTSSGTGAPAGEEWEQTHYGRMCRADLRREERKEERRRRRAESNASTATATSSSIISSSRVPDLVGGAHAHAHGHGQHSRNVSVASSRTSFSSAGGLSRYPSNASNASSSSSRRALASGAGGGAFNMDAVIMEDDDEDHAEWLASSDPSSHAGQPGGKYALPVPPPPKYRVAQQAPHHLGAGAGAGVGRRRPSLSKQHPHGHGHGKKKHHQQLEPFGMGKDMRDVLEEIIQMEKEFVIDENAMASDTESTSGPGAGVFTAVFDRPPRTPSPGPEGRRQPSLLPPGAPLRGAHRKSMSLHHHLAPMQMPDPAAYRPAPARPPSSYGSSGYGFGHSSSLSESHTALYLATASPETASASDSPHRLKVRNSLTFTPEAAGPVIVPGATPSRRAAGGRPSHSPTMHHPTMSGWRFPAPGAGAGAGSGSNAVTPTKLTIDTQNLEPRTPTNVTRNHNHRQRHQFPAAAPAVQPETRAGAQMLWPPFPTSPDNEHQHHDAVRHRHVSPPDSGLTLGYLLGSGSGSGGGGDEDVDMMDLDH